MQILLWIVSGLFGGLSLFAALSQMKSGKGRFPAILMSAGSVLLLAAVACNLAGLGIDSVLALPGCAAVCAAAIWNGVKSGQLHIRHHIVRVALSLLLSAGFLLL